MRTLISADIGTTAAKISLMDEKGNLIAVSSRDYPMATDGPKVEQDPALWWEAFITGTKKVLSSGDFGKPTR